MTRERLPNRRHCDTIAVTHRNVAGGSTTYTVGIGFNEPGQPREVFISHTKVATDLDIAGRDIAILLSLLMQNGVALADVGPALTRDDEGRPQGVAGTIVDALLEGCPA